MRCDDVCSVYKLPKDFSVSNDNHSVYELPKDFSVSNDNHSVYELPKDFSVSNDNVREIPNNDEVRSLSDNCLEAQHVHLIPTCCNVSDVPACVAPYAFTAISYRSRDCV
jgi:hypothetical protein